MSEQAGKDFPTTHDATTGFIDIKPVPSFSATIAWWLWIAIALGILGSFSLFKFFTRKPKAVVSNRPSPAELALSRVRELDGMRVRKQIELRDLGVQLSLTVRGLIEDLLQINAREMTAGELESRLPHTLTSRLRSTSREKQQALGKIAIAIVRGCEQISFADDSDNSFTLEGPELSEIFASVVEFVRELDAGIKREESRNSSVISQGKARDSSSVSVTNGGLR